MSKYLTLYLYTIPLRNKEEKETKELMVCFLMLLFLVKVNKEAFSLMTLV